MHINKASQFLSPSLRMNDSNGSSSSFAKLISGIVRKKVITDTIHCKTSLHDETTTYEPEWCTTQEQTQIIHSCIRQNIYRYLSHTSNAIKC